MSILQRILPFIYLGIVIVFFILGILVLSYVLIIGALVGLALFGIAWIRDRFFVNKPVSEKRKKQIGRTFDQE